MGVLIDRMDTTGELDQRNLLDGWVRRTGSRPAGREGSGSGSPGRDGLRFAFYGRTSTVEYQDRSTSQAWQREVAESVVAGQGVVVAEYFDVGCSRRVPWVRRPQAGALLAALSATDRGFDAVVVGEYERAFYGEQLAHLALEFRRHGVQIWLPEAGGPVDVGSPEHKALMSVLGAQSQREVLRSRHRVFAAMEAQVREQGRYLGGRPPYGYRLGGCRSASESSARWLGASVSTAGSRSGDRAVRAVDVPAACRGAECGGYRPRVE